MRNTLICIFSIYTFIIALSGCNNTAIDNKISANTTSTTEYTTETTTEEPAQTLLNNMSLPEKVGQLFIARCPSYEADVLQSQYQLGGYILFKKDFANLTDDDIKENILSYQNNSNIPMFIGVDEEGGTVNRVSVNPNLRSVPFLSPQGLYKQGGYELIVSDTIEKSKLLSSLGINLNFAPVCDISTNPNDFIYPRSFGKSADETSVYIDKVVSTMKNYHMGSVLKHFPGYGNNKDTHTGIAIDNRDYQTFSDNDFLPFVSGIEAGADMILVSHNIVNCMDSEYPASLSTKVHNILRSTLNFNGVIITDDLSMNAIKQYASDSQSAVLAIEAGNDMLCCTNFKEQYSAVLDAVNTGKITEERINQSVLRILRLKYKLGLLQ